MASQHVRTLKSLPEISRWSLKSLRAEAGLKGEALRRFWSEMCNLPRSPHVTTLAMVEILVSFAITAVVGTAQGRRREL